MMMLRRMFLKPSVQYRGCLFGFCTATSGEKKATRIGTRTRVFALPSVTGSTRTDVVVDTNKHAKTVLLETDVEEKFSRGSGPGGQSVNKARNKVQLLHVPTGITVSCHEQRDLTTNRSIARKLLKDKLDLLLNGDESKLGKRVVRMQRRKSKTASRARKKYDHPSTKGNGDTLADESQPETI